ncbi:MAG: aldehyde dehydrogenase family protein, partial [Elusimicrobia bacterium]|nr:aldehyde dehydrogenase family protein [Elusimicrobiota bacterium]
LLVVTGGEAVVKAAMASGKRAICAGPGNPPVVVDETADIFQAGRDITAGASFDNNIICVDEKTVFAVDSIADDLLRAIAGNGAVILNKSQAMQIERVIFEKSFGPGKPAYVIKSLIGKNISVILSKIGMNVTNKIRLAVIEVGKDHPLVMTEQMMPVLPVVRIKSAKEGIELAKWSERGFRHTASMHSKNITNLSRMAREMDCSIFVKNGPHYAGLGFGGEGHTSFTIASPTGEGLTRPRSFSRERRCVLVDHFRIV